MAWHAGAGAADHALLFVLRARGAQGEVDAVRLDEHAAGRALPEPRRPLGALAAGVVGAAVHRRDGGGRGRRAVQHRLLADLRQLCGRYCTRRMRTAYHALLRPLGARRAERELGGVGHDPRSAAGALQEPGLNLRPLPPRVVRAAVARRGAALRERRRGRRRGRWRGRLGRHLGSVVLLPHGRELGRWEVVACVRRADATDHALLVPLRARRAHCEARVGGGHYDVAAGALAVLGRRLCPLLAGVVRLAIPGRHHRREHCQRSHVCR
mmetsp:Transcript_81021/g.214684  ORF Transcript_81021/g.214684 Transcript_81021/m.214684 type:complete len:268 (-) Transcript_81021:1433-2236(-)